MSTRSPAHLRSRFVRTTPRKLELGHDCDGPVTRRTVVLKTLNPKPRYEFWYHCLSRTFRSQGPEVMGKDWAVVVDI